MLISASFHEEDDTMAHASKSLSAPRQRPGAGFYIARVTRWLRERQEIHMLERMSDSQLKDIGLARSDIDRAVRRDRWK